MPLATVYVASIEKVYPGQAARAAFAASIMASPAQRALYGPIYNDSLGATGVWKAGMFHLLIAVAVILTLIRHTRAEEETGRAEIIESTPVGRYAGLTAALLTSFGASVVTGVVGAVGLLATDVAPAGSLGFGAALTGSGVVFTAVAAVAAQLSSSARIARGVAFAALAAAFTLRAIGDAGSGALSWLSPLGWSLQVRPYAGDRWWVLLLHLAAAAILTALAYWLLARRDVGAGLIAERRGRGDASPLLSGAFGLAWRLDRGSLSVWTAGLALYGLLIGGVVHGIGDELGNSTAVRQIVARMGGAGALEEAFVAASFCMLGIVAAAFAVSMCLRLQQEEDSRRAETLLAGAVRRSRWLASHLAFAVGGSATALLVAGLVAGITYGVAAGDLGGKLSSCARDRGSATAGRVADRRVERGRLRAGAAVRVRGVGCAGRFRRAVPARLGGRTAAVAAESRAVRPHSTNRRGFHGDAPGAAAGNGRGVDRAGNTGYSVSGSAVMRSR